MKSWAVLPVALSTSCASTVGVAPSRVAAPPADASCIVWERENQFAASVAAHDANAFAEHVHPGAVFLQDDGPALKGRQAIVRGWESILRGESLHLEWHPTSVVQTGDPNVALSRGPYWVEFTKPGADPRFLAGQFQSTWVLDVDGVWRVLIDGGTPPAKPATPEELERIKAAIPPRCTPSSVRRE